MREEDLSVQNEKLDAVEQFYRESFEVIRAPETLKEETLRKMLARQKAPELDKAQPAETENRGGTIISLFKAPGSIYRLAALAAAFVLIITGAIFSFGQKGNISPIYADGLSTDYAAVFRAAGDIHVTESDGELLPFDLPDPLKDFHLSETHSYSVMDADGNELDSVIRVCYEHDEKKLTVVLSRNQTLAPAALYSVNPQQISGVTVYLGKSTSDKSLYAAWSTNDYMAAACLNNGTERTFIKLLEALLAKG